MNEQPLSTGPQALLWDMDGTIVDTEPYWIVAEQELAALFDATWTHEDGIAVVGQGLPYTATRMQERGVELDLHDIIEALTTRVLEQLDQGVPWRPGALELLTQAQEAGYPQALVTMSIRRMALKIAELIPGQPFEFVVSGSDVTHSKPDPEAYVLAASQLGVEIENCIAFEDSPSGCTSAFTAGAFTIGIPHLVTLDSAPTHVVLSTLSEVSLGTIEELFRQPRLGLVSS